MNRADASSQFGSVPDFGFMVRRDRLLRVARGLGQGILLVCAPSGYGKSVLAAQIACDLGDSAVWISASEIPPDMRTLSALVARRLGAALPEITSGGAASSPCETQELLQLIGQQLRTSSARLFCLVLDDLNPDLVGDVVRDFSPALMRPAPLRTLIIVTSRAARPSSAGFRGCVLSLDDLRFTPEEAVQVVRTAIGEDEGDPPVHELLRLTQGQPASLAVAARHVTLGPTLDSAGRGGSADLRACLLELAERQLDRDSKRVLYVAALLGRGIGADVDAVADLGAGKQLRRIADCIPLLRLGSGPSQSTQFLLHDIACGIFGSIDFSDGVEGTDVLRGRAIDHLTRAGRHARALGLLMSEPVSVRLASWLSENGASLIAAGHSAEAERALAVLSPADTMSPGVLVLAARVALEHEDFDMALRRATVARRLAAEAGDAVSEVDALMLAGRVQLSRGCYREAAGMFEALLGLDSTSESIDTRAAIAALGGVAAAIGGDGKSAALRALDARRLVQSPSVSPETCSRIANYQAFVWYYLGHSSEALRALRAVSGLTPVASRTREYVLGNLAAAMMEMGRTARALSAYARLEEHCEHGGRSPAAGFWTTRAACLFALGDVASGMTLARDSIEACETAGDHISAQENLVFSSVMHLAFGDAEAALSDAEESLELAASLGADVSAERAAVQLRAALLAMGDVDSARHVASSAQWARERGARQIALLADLVLAECARIDGDLAASVAHVSASAEQLLSGNSNWVAAMYVRAFPGLLGVIAAAVGADKVPLRMLRILLPEHLSEAMPLARGALSPAEWDVLARRARFSAPEPAPESTPEPATSARRGSSSAVPLRVRMFGGLEVSTPSGVVTERAWRKRKARLLFAMLCVRRGRDVPRDLVLDRLWPDLEAGPARNNYYVTWSAMKQALMPGATRGDACPWVESVGEICRTVPGAVTTDLDDFDVLLAEARSADDAGAALCAYSGLAEVYRGELLPGDAYDDWFTPARDSYRHAFSDAMVEASTLAEDRDDPAEALRFARLGLAHDPWREDLYQLALSHQISTGQRSAAIETYFACRTRLVEDLGLDPSRETVRLYERVLAMEDDMSGSQQAL